MARQPTVLAFLVALGVAALLALLVLLPWTGGGSSGSEADATRLAAVGSSDDAGPTPTPRAIRPGANHRATPAPPPSARRTTNPIQAPDDSEPDAAAPTATRVRPKPTATAARPTATAVPTATSTPETLFEVAGAAGLAALAGGSWALEDDQLVSAGPRTPEPWIVVPEPPPSGEYAVEAEFRVRELVPDVCAQSFGLVVGDPTATVWGGGMFYPCAQQGPGPLARFTDITNVGNGYYADPELVSERFDLETGWRTFRLEVRDDELRLLIDDEEVITAPVDRGTVGSAEQVGFWSEGVQVALRRFAVIELDDESV